LIDLMFDQSTLLPKSLDRLFYQSCSIDFG